MELGKVVTNVKTIEANYTLLEAGQVICCEAYSAVLIEQSCTAFPGSNYFRKQPSPQ